VLYIATKKSIFFLKSIQNENKKINKKRNKNGNKKETKTETKTETKSKPTTQMQR
jgi:hypothetical protein